MRNPIAFLVFAAACLTGRQGNDGIIKSYHINEIGDMVKCNNSGRGGGFGMNVYMHRSASKALLVPDKGATFDIEFISPPGKFALDTPKTRFGRSMYADFIKTKTTADSGIVAHWNNNRYNIMAAGVDPSGKPFKQTIRCGGACAR